MLKLVIFDMDGLMFDTEAVMCRAFLEVTRENGTPGSKDQFVSMLGLSRKDVEKGFYACFGNDIDAADLYRRGGERKLKILKEEGIPVKKGLFRLLKEIDRLGLVKAVASSSEKEMILSNLRQAGLDTDFDLILSAGTVPRGKPWPDLFLTVCEELGIEPGEALVLEDSVNGVKAALAGGIPVIQVPDFLELPDDLKDRCLAVCPSLDEVVPLLETLCRQGMS